MKRSQVKTAVFLSNFYNHHQKPFADAMYARLGEGYHFIETSPMTEERKNMGWGEATIPDYVITSDRLQNDRAGVQAIIDEADVVIFGSAPRALLDNRLKAKKLTFFYYERLIRWDYKKWKYPFRLVTWRRYFKQGKNTRLLCTGAFAAADFAKFFLFRNRTYKWAYFTELKKYDDVDGLIAAKKPNSILWVSRFIGLKHPDHAVETAKRLKAAGYDFKLSMIGNGELEESVKALVEKNGLSDCVELLGSMKPEQVREHMEKSEIFLFTSDHNEGWGAVVNESMNSGCAVVASHAIGAVPFLVDGKENGLIYKDGDLDDLYEKIKYLLDHKEERIAMGHKAYLTMAEEWNGENAAQKVITLAETLLDGEGNAFPFERGVCSKAERLAVDWIE